jgi:hypothetical protein
LDVAGYVKGTGLCIGSDCRTSWPAGGVPKLSQKYVATVVGSVCPLICESTINMGVHSFCALVGERVHPVAFGEWKCLVNYSNGSWSLTAYTLPDSVNILECSAMCIDF